MSFSVSWHTLLDELDDLETNVLVNVYTLCSDVQRNANEFRKDVADVLLDRLHHDQPVHGQYGSVQRTSRRNRSIRDDEAADELTSFRTGTQMRE